MTQRYESYVIDIEVDADSGTVTLTKGDFSTYTYTVEELESKGVIENSLKGGASGTVYSQGETFTINEFIALFGIDALKRIEEIPDYLRY